MVMAAAADSVDSDSDPLEVVVVVIEVWSLKFESELI